MHNNIRVRINKEAFKKKLDLKDGEPGKPGYTPKKGVDYFDGKDGKDGRDGKDGTSYTIETVINEVRRTISYEDLKDKPNLEPLRPRNLAGTGYLREVSDVSISNPKDGDALTYEAKTGLWKNKAGSSGGGTWGSITGTLSAQTDLQNALNAKQNTITTGLVSQYFRGDLSLATLDTSVVPENTNLYYTAARFNSAFAAKSTSDLAEGSNLYFTQARAIASPLTGYVSGAGTVLATDSILQAIQKLNGNVGLLTGSIIYQGTWNASTNTPTLVSGVGTKGYLYKVSVAGTTSIDGISQWNVGDSIVFDGTVWDKIDGIATEVLSVFGRVGNVVATSGDYTTAQVTESGNLYFTGARVLATRLTGFSSAPGTITGADTVLSAIDKLDGNIGALVTGVSSVSGTPGKITVSATTGAVAVTISSLYLGQPSITTLGTIATGTWQGTAIAPAYMTTMTSTVGGTVPTPPNDATKFLNGTGAWTVPSGSSVSPGNPSASVGLAAVNGSAVTYMRSDGAPALDVSIAPTWTGVHIFTPGARTGVTSPYFTINAPADTAIPASTEAIGIKHTGATRTWVDGTVATQREYFFGAPTYNKTTTSATFTTASSVYVSGAPIAGAGVTITNAYSIFIDGNNARIGGTTAQTKNSDVGGIGLEICGTNNTSGGMNLILSNSSNGTSAFTSIFLQNDISTSAGTHYGNIGMNSSTYNDTTFGTLLAIPNQMGMTNTDGPITLAAFSASAYINFAVGGSSLSNIVMNLTASAITVSAPILEVENSQSGTTYTLVLSDGYNKAVTSTSASATTFTVPPNSSVAFPINTRIDVIQLGTGKLTIAAGAGVTINSQNNNKSMATQYVGATLWKQGTNTWVLMGNLIA